MSPGVHLSDTVPRAGATRRSVQAEGGRLAVHLGGFLSALAKMARRL